MPKHPAAQSETLSIRHARWYFAVFLITMAVAVYQTSSALPDRIVAHLGRVTAADLRESGHRHQALTAVATAVVPAILYYMLGILPTRPRPVMVLPHHEYWFDSERRAATADWNEKFMLLFCSGVAVFIYCLNGSAVHSVRLPNGEFYFPWLPAIVSAWVAYIIIAAAIFKRRFGRLPRPPAGD